MSCFWRHKWYKWVDTPHKGMLHKALGGYIVRNNVGSWQEQKRVCKICGVSELRTVKNLF